MMAQNTPDDKEISDLDYHQTKKPSESAELIPVGASNVYLKSYLDGRLEPGVDDFDRVSPQTSWKYEEFMRSRGQVYEETLRQARTNKATRSDTERNDDERIEDFFVGVVEDDFKNYEDALPMCRRSECWAATEGFVNIVVALIRRRGADNPKSVNEGLRPTPISKELLALVIAAENNDLIMVDALKEIAVAEESFRSNEPDLFSPARKKLRLFDSEDCDEPVYSLYLCHEVWLCPIEAAARLGHVDMVKKLSDLGEAKIESDLKMDDWLGEARMKKELSGMMRHEKSKWRRAFAWAVRMGRHEVVKLLIDRDYIVDSNKASNLYRLLDNVEVKSYGPDSTSISCGQWTLRSCQGLV
jgi:hypothetical protein